MFRRLTGCGALASKLDNVLLDLGGNAHFVSICLIGGIVSRITNVALDQLGGAREYGRAEAEIPFPLPMRKSEVSDCRKETVAARVREHVRATYCEDDPFWRCCLLSGDTQSGEKAVVELSRSREG
jgi:hypothetical protein